MKNKSIYDDVIKLKENNFKNKEIAEKLNVSLNSVEKTLQLNRLHLKFKDCLNNELYNKLLNLNFKALEIRHIQEEPKLVVDLLEMIDRKTTLNELKQKIELLKTKQYQVDSIKSDIETTNNNISKIKNEIKDLESKYKDIVKNLDSKFKFIEEDTDLSDSKKKQLLQAIAYDTRLDKYVFVGFIDTNKFFYLKNKGLISYDENYISYSGYLPPAVIPDIEKFVKYVKKAKDFKADFQTKYTRNKNLIWADRKDKEQKNITKVKEELKDKKKQLREHNKQLKKITDSDLNNFMTVLEAKNELTKKDILKHNELSIKGMKWLKHNGFIADIEYSYNNYRFDVIGINLDDNKVVILEAKVSLNDYKQDTKKEKYLEYCNELYIITDNYSVKLEAENNRNITGVVYYDKYRNDINIYMNESNCINSNPKIDKLEVVKKIYDKYWNKIYKL